MRELREVWGEFPKSIKIAFLLSLIMPLAAIIAPRATQIQGTLGVMFAVFVLIGFAQLAVKSPTFRKVMGCNALILGGMLFGSNAFFLEPTKYHLPTSIVNEEAWAAITTVSMVLLSMLGLILFNSAMRTDECAADKKNKDPQLGGPIDAENLEPGDYTVACAYISPFGVLYVVTMQGGLRLIRVCCWSLDNSEFKPNELRADKATSIIDYITVEQKRGLNDTIVVTPHRYQLVDPPAPEENNPAPATEPESG